ncbi:hypothetical protein ABL78_5052 [Leptomonas seymouri]|uniref:Uncharacterized protein n=1 Tax=Leptomonas seymouri TaxID=5684 RepID=A0A0N1IK53_LEPSE|nr:hypothetical protein ABL78_5052 [Leptomonas seymouri]|eukprot:KPI85871.1 hypothetical protein ABL78_5052 [Leptomonas seymouri]
MAEAKPLSVKRSFLEPLRVPKAAAKANAAENTSAGFVKASPKTSVEWLQLASQLLIASGNSRPVEERVLLMCEEAAGMLLEDDAKAHTAQQRRSLTTAETETAVYSPQEGMGVEDNAAAGTASGADGSAEDTDAAPAPSTERLQAAYLLTAASMAAVESHRLPVAESAIRLARAAVEAYRCPMTACTMAGACVHWGMVSCDQERRSAAYQTAVTVIASTCKDLLDAESMTAEVASYAVRMAWMLVEVGAVNQSREPLTAVLQAYPKNYMALLLLSLLHTVDGDYESANAAIIHLLEAYPNDVVGVVVHAAVQQRCRGPTEADAYAKDPGAVPHSANIDSRAEEAGEVLAVAMARILKLSDEATLAQAQGVKKKSLKGLCTHCAPDEEIEGGPQHSHGELKRRVVGHWALLSHVAARLGCMAIAEVSIAAGTDLVPRSELLYYRSFADLQCSQARLSLIRLRESVAAQHNGRYGPPTTTLVRDMNLLGQWDVDTMAANSTPTLGLPLTAAASEGLSSTPPLSGGPSHRLVSSKRFDAVFATVLAAVEAYPNHAEGHTLLGVTRLLEASQVDLPSDTRHNRLQEAGRHFFNAMRADGTSPEAYLGAGVVAEAQGAMAESYDYYTSAAEVSTQAPLIPWRYFHYLYE